MKKYLSVLFMVSFVLSVVLVPELSLAQTNGATCSPTSVSSIKVLSPNGGEVFMAGQQVTVRWSSCNISTSGLVNILLSVPSMNWDLGLIQSNTLNDGLETVTLPSTATVASLKYGNLFKIKIAEVANTANYSQDSSDNTFTINSGVKVLGAFTSSACASFKTTLKKGMKSLEVKCLQMLLNEKGFTVAGTAGGLETTYFGNATLAALLAFQTNNGLVADGVFGARSRATLLAN